MMLLAVSLPVLLYELLLNLNVIGLILRQRKYLKRQKLQNS